jgi:ActR/RegA family two-component response regulator
MPPDDYKGKIPMDQNLVVAENGNYQVVKAANEIFVVDDDEDMRDILAGSLESEGFSVAAFEDGDSFLRAAEMRVPICVFLDVVLPQRSGLEILQELRKRQYWTPIFLVSALDDITTAVEGIKNAAHDLLENLLTALCRWHGRAMQSRCGLAVSASGAPLIFIRMETTNGFEYRPTKEQCSY